MTTKIDMEYPDEDSTDLSDEEIAGAIQTKGTPDIVQYVSDATSASYAADKSLSSKKRNTVKGRRLEVVG